MQATSSPSSTTEITWQDKRYAARVIAGGAAFELYSDTHEQGFEPAGRAFHRYVHASEVASDGGELLRAGDSPIALPVMPGADVRTVQRLSQDPRIGVADRALVAAVRATAVVQPGTRMVKALNRQQVARQLTSAPLVGGVCFREFDVAHLRTPADRTVLAGDPDNIGDVSFALRWRAVCARDYFTTEASNLPGLVNMPGRERRGSMILGTGFLPSGHHLIPEFATDGLADLPLPVGAEILAYLADGTEIVLFQYQPQHSAWDRVAGPRHRDLIGRIPGLEDGRALFRVDAARHAGLTGEQESERVPVVADPGHGFVAYVKGAASRNPVERPWRFYTKARWREADCLVLGRNHDWVRLRLAQPDVENAQTTGATCVERAVYECWAPRAELEHPRTVTIEYALHDDTWLTRTRVR
jgi:hypothetical protein